jgi:hypothetical protein
MPRDGSGVYSQPYPNVVEGTTIESVVYNGYTADVTIDLNSPRPISSGGTGANNAVDAMNNLGGEISKIQVSNYDSHAFTAGSFYSLAGATSAPVAGHAFAGFCYPLVIAGVATTDMFIEASDKDDVGQPGAKWVRQKKANVWSGWQKATGAASGLLPPSPAPDNTLWWDPTRGKLFIRYNDGDSVQWVEAVAVPDIDPNTFVEIAGDIMTGPLTLSGNAVNALHAVPKQQLEGSAVRYDIAQTLTSAQQKQGRDNIGVGGVFNCGQLTFVSTTALAFKPYNGDAIRINGALYQIPAAGIAGLGAPTSVFLNGVAAQSLAINATYYVYAFVNSGVVTADFIPFASGGHSTSATAGNVGTEIKTGDESRTLIGMIRTGATVVYLTQATMTLSWFNRRSKSNYVSTAAGTTQAAQSFLTWGDETASLSYDGITAIASVSNSTSQHQLDAANLGQAMSWTTAGPNYQVPVSSRVDAVASEGLHIYAVFLTLGGSATAASFSSSVMVRG